jgi:hypothetical protein
MNTAALRRTVTKIEKAVQKPTQVFDMTGWVWEVKAPVKAVDEPDEYCGTAACFAGYAVSKQTRKKHLRLAIEDEVRGWWGFDTDLIRTEASQKLGLTTSVQQTKLFATTHWPVQFQVAYREAAEKARGYKLGTKRRIKAELAKVKILRDRVEHFIKTNGEE